MNAPTGSLELAADGPPRRRQADRRGPVRETDRLGTMLVMAALLHGLLILGVSFDAVRDGRSEGIGMEVLLVSDELPESRDNEGARYLAQRTQSGSGNTAERAAARLPGAPDPGAAAPEAGREQPPEPQAEATLTTSGASAGTRFTAQSVPESAPAPAAASAVPAPLRAELDTEVLLRGERRDELHISPDTRASEVAPWLAAWKRRVERVGTVNYPSAAQRRGLAGNPVVEVAIGADGHLRSAAIRRSSGHAEIDAAALDILRLASPFEPFPAELAARHDQLRFAYEWQFQGGRLGGAVSLP